MSSITILRVCLDAYELQTTLKKKSAMIAKSSFLTLRSLSQVVKYLAADNLDCTIYETTEYRGFLVIYNERLDITKR